MNKNFIFGFMFLVLLFIFGYFYFLDKKKGELVYVEPIQESLSACYFYENGGIGNEDGFSSYQNKIDLSPGLKISENECIALKEKALIEKYVRENIVDLVKEKPVLGGTWYVVSIEVSPSNKSGSVVYEDGHIQGEASFSYAMSGDVPNITFKDKE